MRNRDFSKLVVTLAPRHEIRPQADQRQSDVPTEFENPKTSPGDIKIPDPKNGCESLKK